MLETSRSSSQGITSKKELLRRAKALIPLLREDQEETEQSGRVSDKLFDALTDAEIFKILLPRRYGGFEYGLDTFVDVGFEVARGCGSVGWVNTVTGMYHVFLGMYPGKAQDEVWGENSRTVVAASFPPTGYLNSTANGFYLTGFWSYCSGIDNCPWIIVAAKILSPDGTDSGDKGYALVPTHEMQIIDDWQVVGLHGTGSKSVTCEKLFVPSHRFLALEDTMTGNPPGADHNAGDLYKIPLFSAMSCSLVAPIMGMAQGALDEFVQLTSDRTTRGAALSQPSPMAKLSGIQLKVGEAAASIDAARLLVDRDLKDIMATISEKRKLTIEQRARNKGDWGFAARLSVRAVDLLFQASGGGGLYSEGRLQRYWRDIHAASSHISMNWDAVGALYGRVMLGLPPGPAQF